MKIIIPNEGKVSRIKIHRKENKTIKGELLLSFSEINNNNVNTKDETIIANLPKGWFNNSISSFLGIENKCTIMS